jgi:Flp pilus assembly pilin Flp
VLKLSAFAQVLAVEAADGLRRDEEAQTMAEYGVVLSVITVTIIAAISLLSENVQSAIETVAGLVPG